MKINRIDHLVLTVRDIDLTCAFYSRVLGMRVITFGSGRRALGFGKQKINLHQLGHLFPPHAEFPTPGSADLCLILDTPLQEALQHLRACNVNIIEGPVPRSGAAGAIASIYIRDPDQNLIEISEVQS